MDRVNLKDYKDGDSPMRDICMSFSQLNHTVRWSSEADLDPSNCLNRSCSSAL